MYKSTYIVADLVSGPFRSIIYFISPFFWATYDTAKTPLPRAPAIIFLTRSPAVKPAGRSDSGRFIDNSHGEEVADKSNDFDSTCTTQTDSHKIHLGKLDRRAFLCPAIAITPRCPSG